MKLSTKYLYRSAGIGDVLWTEPLLRALASSHRKLVLFTRYTALFENYPLPNVSVRPVPPGWQRAILKVLNFFTGNRLYFKLDGVYEACPQMHILHAYQQFFALPFTNDYPVLHLGKDEELPIPEMPVNYVVLHLEANSPENFRKVYGVDFNEVVKHLHNHKLEVVVTGYSPEVYAGSVAFNGSLRQLIRLIYHAKFFVGVDSGPSHIAASLKKPSIIFFGAVNPAYRHFPEHFNGLIMQQTCEHPGCYHVAPGIEKKCFNPLGKEAVPQCCMHTTIAVQQNIDWLLEQYCLVSLTPAGT